MCKYGITVGTKRKYVQIKVTTIKASNGDVNYVNFSYISEETH